MNIKRIMGVVLAAGLLAGCDGALQVLKPRAKAPPPPVSAAPTPAARNAEDFDTTSAAERAAAAAPAPTAPDKGLGTTIASLGDPAEPGFWAKTPLVDAVQPGRLVYPVTGASVAVELRPLAADTGAGSQVSLAAMRLLGAPLTALPELEVYAQ